MNEVSELNKLCTGTMISHIGIEFTDSGKGFVKARMPVDKRTNQPSGILHGGASLALAETVGSAGSYLMIDRTRYNVVCMQISGNHISKVFSGFVYAHATILYRGSRTHLWDVRISDENDKTIAMCRLTNMLIEIKR